MRTSKPITITLGQQQASLDARLQSGSYASASEVMRAGLRALDREDAALDEIMRLKIREAIHDPKPDIPASDVFERLRARQDNALKAGKRDA